MSDYFAVFGLIAGGISTYLIVRDGLQATQGVLVAPQAGGGQIHYLVEF